jgi:hypothetical protein
MYGHEGRVEGLLPVHYCARLVRQPDAHKSSHNTPSSIGFESRATCYRLPKGMCCPPRPPRPQAVHGAAREGPSPLPRSRPRPRRHAVRRTSAARAGGGAEEGGAGVDVEVLLVGPKGS